MNETTYSVYVKTDEQNNITAVNSSAFLTDATGWTKIDEGAGDKYHHAQGNYFNKPVMTMEGIYRYRLDDGEPVEKTAQEIADEIAALPPLPPSDMDALMSIAVDQEYRLTLLELGV